MRTKTILLKALGASVESAAESSVPIPAGTKAIVVYVDVPTVTGTSPTLNVFIQDGIPAVGNATVVGQPCDGAYEFMDYIAFTQITTAADKVARKDFTGEEESAHADAALTAGQLRNGPLTDKIRVKWTIGGTNPSFTFSVRAMLIYEG